jgi:hypothetical protein
MNVHVGTNNFRSIAGEATLVWTIGKRRRAEGGFVGAKPVLQQVWFDHCVLLCWC